MDGRFFATISDRRTIDVVRGAGITCQNVALRGAHQVTRQRIVEIREVILAKTATVHRSHRLRHRLWFEDTHTRTGLQGRIPSTFRAVPAP